MKWLIVFLLAASPLFAQNPKATKPKPKVPQPPAGVRVERNITYVKRGLLPLKLDVYLPEKMDVQKKLPVVIWIHGGGWKQGSKDRCKAAWLPAGGEFAVVSIQYRLIGQGKWPDQIDDCYEAVRWVRMNAAKYNFDPEHIGAWGGSAGGHLAVLLGTRQFDGLEEISSRVQAVCDWYGPTELLTMPPNTISEKRTREMVEQSNGAKLLGKTVMDVPELANDASGLHHVSEDDPPFLIMHGEEDPGVPPEQSRKLHTALLKAGVESELIMIPGAGHGGKEFQTDHMKSAILDFFRKSLIRND